MIGRNWMKKIYIANDHAGYELKLILINYLQGLNYTITDCGCESVESVDYPDYSYALANKMKNQDDSCGILICGSGVGMSIAVNRFDWIRGVLVYSEDIKLVQLSRSHNDCNVLCLGSRMLSADQALNIMEKFLNTQFLAGQHARRVQKLYNCT